MKTHRADSVPTSDFVADVGTLGYGLDNDMPTTHHNLSETELLDVAITYRQVLNGRSVCSRGGKVKGKGKAKAKASGLDKIYNFSRGGFGRSDGSSRSSRSGRSFSLNKYNRSSNGPNRSDRSSSAGRSDRSPRLLGRDRTFGFGRRNRSFGGSDNSDRLSKSGHVDRPSKPGRAPASHEIIHSSTNPSRGNGRKVKGLVGRPNHAPGDSYRSQNEAARNASRDIKSRTVREKRESGGVIYQRRDGTYSYTSPVQGNENTVYPYDAKTPKDTASTAYYHSHADIPGLDSVNFSRADKEVADQQGNDAYLVTPDGSIREYDHETGETIDVGVVPSDE